MKPYMDDPMMEADLKTWAKVHGSNRYDAFNLLCLYDTYATPAYSPNAKPLPLQNKEGYMWPSLSQRGWDFCGCTYCEKVFNQCGGSAKGPAVSTKKHPKPEKTPFQKMENDWVNSGLTASEYVKSAPHKTVLDIVGWPTDPDFDIHCNCMTCAKYKTSATKTLINMLTLNEESLQTKNVAPPNDYTTVTGISTKLIFPGDFNLGASATVPNFATLDLKPGDQVILTVDKAIILPLPNAVKAVVVKG